MPGTSSGSALCKMGERLREPRGRSLPQPAEQAIGLAAYGTPIAQMAGAGCITHHQAVNGIEGAARSESEQEAIRRCGGRVRQQVALRHIGPGEHDLVAGTEEVHPAPVALRRLVVMDRIRIAESREIPGIQQPDAQILLLALVEERLAIAADGQEGSAKQRMGGAGEGLLEE